MKASNNIDARYADAKEQYAAFGVNVDKAVATLASIPLSIHCWQGDDVMGFDGATSLSGGIVTTGAYPGRARNGQELRADLDFAFSLIPGKKRCNLHAMYAETKGKKVDRDELEADHFFEWIQWAKTNKIGLDFNPTFFSHPLAASGFTLASSDKKTRAFWIRHAQACRRIATTISKKLDDTVVHNIWIPDGYKDIPADRLGPRMLLKESLDTIFDDSTAYSRVVDSVESKLFGIGSESYVVGSHEFYMGYAIRKALALCLDMGHFHPTESIADKISSLLFFVPRIVLHLSRGVRWDSDHILLWNEELETICKEIIRANALDRVSLALDYFDASINRIAAWVIGARSAQKALLSALLEPSASMRQHEQNGDFFNRLAIMEETKTLPFSTVWEYYCQSNNMPTGGTWMEHVAEYEKKVLHARL